MLIMVLCQCFPIKPLKGNYILLDSSMPLPVTSLIIEGKRDEIFLMLCPKSKKCFYISLHKFEPCPQRNIKIKTGLTASKVRDSLACHLLFASLSCVRLLKDYCETIERRPTLPPSLQTGATPLVKRNRVPI